MEAAIVDFLLGKAGDSLMTRAVEEYKLVKDVKEELQKLESTLLTIQAVLAEAEKRKVTEKDLVDWLVKLKDAVYDADDVFDAFATEALQRKAKSGWSVVQKICGFFSGDNPILSRRRMGRRIKTVMGRLDGIAEERRKFHLSRGTESTNRIRSVQNQTHSFVDESGVVGRDGDRETLVDILIGSGGGGGRGVVSIVGMGGLGKTTLVKMVYNDPRVVLCFQQRMWVHVSEDFSLPRLLRAIIEQATRNKCELSDLDLLGRILQEKLLMKRFLLVLDDVWNEDRRKWLGLRELLECGAQGSRILVTTRSEKVSKVMDSLAYRLARMDEEECWSLFRKMAFGTGRKEEANLVEIGKEISKKSGGLPLAASVLGGLMRDKSDESEWLSIKNSEIWEMMEEDDEILPALRLSYDHLPSRSKPCFAYCSIVPKNHYLEKETLIQQWIANGLLQVQGRVELEAIGSAIFDDLLSRFLFQDARKDEFGNITSGKMHDLIHDLASSVAGSVCCILSDPWRGGPLRRARFLSVGHDPSSELPQVIYKAENLRTFLTLSANAISIKTLYKVFNKFKFLRVLDLSGTSVHKIPKSISNLKHLRYLNLSTTKISTLPGSITSLLNLQTWRLARCDIRELPKGLKNMSSLRHIDIHGCRLNRMPMGIGQLTCLQTLTDFFVSKEEGSSSIKELKGLNLHGELSIWNLENAECEADAKGANLMSREGLRFLCLSWTKGGMSTMQLDTELVLDALQPHRNLKHLRLCNYGGIKLPVWMEDPSRNLVKLALWYPEMVDELPALGQLQSLKYLQLIGLRSLNRISRAFYGNNGTVNGFPSLKELAFNDMPVLEEWSEMEGHVVFPALQTLTISNCPKLEVVPLIPSLQRIELWNCHVMLLTSVADLPSLSTLLICKIHNLTSLPEGSLTNLTSLKKLIITDCVELVSLPHEMVRCLTSLEHLKIAGCKHLSSLPESICDLNCLGGLEISYCNELTVLPQRFECLSSLESMRIVECLGIDSWSEAGIQSVCALQKFHVETCNKRTDLSMWLRFPKNLRSLRVHGGHNVHRRMSDQVGDNHLSVCCCEDMVFLPEGLNRALGLEDLAIYNCNALKALPESLSNLRSLGSLSILSCPQLMSLPEGLRSLPLLRFLWITMCPMLEVRCRKEGEDWHIVSHIPNKIIGSFQSSAEETGNGTGSWNRRRASRR